MKLTASAVVAVTVLLAATTAFAHPGHDVSGLAAGMEHPLSGADHLLAMVAVGIWAGLRGGRAAWAWPASFVGFMVVGGALGAAGVQLPYAETGVTLSVLVLGALIGFGAQPSTLVGALLCAAFATFHGWAHGAEMPMEASGLAYGVGFVAVTALLHGAGLITMRLLGAGVRTRLGRVLGVTVAGGGVALLMS